MLSMREALIFCVMADGCPSFSLNTDSITEISVEVVSCQKMRFKKVQAWKLPRSLDSYLSTKCSPVVDDHSSPKDVRAPVHCSSHQRDLNMIIQF